MIAIKLGDQIARRVTEGKLFAVTREHDLGYVNAEKLALLSLAKTVEEDVIDGAFSAADDGLSTILVQVLRLVLHINLLLQLQIILAEDKDLAFKSHINICGATNG